MPGAELLSDISNVSVDFTVGNTTISLLKLHICLTTGWYHMYRNQDIDQFHFDDLEEDKRYLCLPTAGGVPIICP